MKCVLYLIETAMGTNLDVTKDDVRSYKSAIRKMGYVFITRFSRFWLRIPLIYYFTSTKRIEEVETGVLHRFTTSIIRERRSTRTKEDNDIDVDKLVDDEVFGKKKRLAMLDLLLKAESEGLIDEDGVREEVDTFTFEVCYSYALEMKYSPNFDWF
jgi:cytochrome P450 family 4